MLPMLYNGKCYNPLFFFVQLLFLAVLIHSYFVSFLSHGVRSFLTWLLVVYYVFLFIHMTCFLEESFNPEKTWKVSQKKERQKRLHV